jgi:CRP-like cAMP-binding protein
MQQLLKHLQTYYRISDSAQQALCERFEQVELNKNDFLLGAGRVCRSLYFLESGCLRGYYHLGEKEVTHWFGFENDFVTSYHSFITQQPAVENIQLIERSVLWAISKETLSALFNDHHDIERLVRIATEKYYLRLEERFVNGHFKTAGERYRMLLQQQPHVLERVPLGYIASYLGISQETLSRIRSKF